MTHVKPEYYNYITDCFPFAKKKNFFLNIEIEKKEQTQMSLCKMWRWVWEGKSSRQSAGGNTYVGFIRTKSNN